MIYFTSDLHFFHKRMLEHFKETQENSIENVEEMHEFFIKNWNNTVKEQDEVYILGDFSFGNATETAEIAKRLKGRKYLVIGNHDYFLKKKDWSSQVFIWEKELTTIKWEKQQFILCHYPLLVWKRSHYGSFHLHGHLHSEKSYNEENRNSGIKRYDAGVWGNQYAPISIAEIVDFFKDADSFQQESALFPAPQTSPNNGEKYPDSP